MSTVADGIKAVNTEKQQLKQALIALGVPMDNVPFTEYPAIIYLLV